MKIHWTRKVIWVLTSVSSPKYSYCTWSAENYHSLRLHFRICLCIEFNQSREFIDGSNIVELGIYNHRNMPGLLVSLYPRSFLFILSRAPMVPQYCSRFLPFPPHTWLSLESLQWATSLTSCLTRTPTRINPIDTSSLCVPWAVGPVIRRPP
jgi:hypothetical protein